RPEHYQARLALAEHREEEPLETHEGLIAVLGDGLPERRRRELGPAPLAPVPVPVADEDVEEPRLEERAGVDAAGGRGLQPLPELLAADDLGGAFEPGVATADGTRVDLDG